MNLQQPRTWRYLPDCRRCNPSGFYLRVKCTLAKDAPEEPCSLILRLYYFANRSWQRIQVIQGHASTDCRKFLTDNKKKQPSPWGWLNNLRSAVKVYLSIIFVLGYFFESYPHRSKTSTSALALKLDSDATAGISERHKDTQKRSLGNCLRRSWTNKTKGVTCDPLHRSHNLGKTQGKRQKNVLKTIILTSRKRNIFSESLNLVRMENDTASWLILLSWHPFRRMLPKCYCRGANSYRCSFTRWAAYGGRARMKTIGPYSYSPINCRIVVLFLKLGCWWYRPSHWRSINYSGYHSKTLSLSTSLVQWSRITGSEHSTSRSFWGFEERQYSYPDPRRFRTCTPRRPPHHRLL